MLTTKGGCETESPFARNRVSVCSKQSFYLLETEPLFGRYPFFCFRYSRGDAPMILLNRREK